MHSQADPETVACIVLQFTSTHTWTQTHMKAVMCTRPVNPTRTCIYRHMYFETHSIRYPCTHIYNAYKSCTFAHVHTFVLMHLSAHIHTYMHMSTYRDIHAQVHKPIYTHM